MALLIRAASADWGGAHPNDVEAVARSVASSLDAFDGHTTAIVLEPTARVDDPPIVFVTPNEQGEVVVKLNVRGNLWAKLAYQVAHELCHVIADPRMLHFDRFLWVEESLCETASLFALRELARTWAVEPPYPNWSDYAGSLAGYYDEHVAEPARTLPPGVEFGQWLTERLPTLEGDGTQRDDNTIVARQLLPFAEADPYLWRAVRFLHRGASRPHERSLAEFLECWVSACPIELKPTATRLVERLV